MREYDSLYKQLMNSILEKIRRGEFQPGDRLDSERSMATQYGINRMTVRRALKELEDQGYLQSFRGKGTFVARTLPLIPQIEQGRESDISLSMQIRQSGYAFKRNVISFRKVPAQGEVAEFFHSGEQMYEIVRLSFANDKPYAVQKAYIPSRIFWDADRYDFSEGSLYEYMEMRGSSPRRIDNRLWVDYPPREYAELLFLPPDKKVFVVMYEGYDMNEEKIEYTFSYYLPQYTSFRYVVSLGGQNGSSLEEALLKDKT